MIALILNAGKTVLIVPQQQYVQAANMVIFCSIHLITQSSAFNVLALILQIIL